MIIVGPSSLLPSSGLLFGEPSGIVSLAPLPLSTIAALVGMGGAAVARGVIAAQWLLPLLCSLMLCLDTGRLFAALWEEGALEEAKDRPLCLSTSVEWGLRRVGE